LSSCYSVLVEIKRAHSTITATATGER